VPRWAAQCPRRRRLHPTHGCHLNRHTHAATRATSLTRTCSRADGRVSYSNDNTTTRIHHISRYTAAAVPARTSHRAFNAYLHVTFAHKSFFDRRRTFVAVTDTRPWDWPPPASSCTQPSTRRGYLLTLDGTFHPYRAGTDGGGRTGGHGPFARHATCHGGWPPHRTRCVTRAATRSMPEENTHTCLPAAHRPAATAYRYRMLRYMSSVSSTTSSHCSIPHPASRTRDHRHNHQCCRGVDAYCINNERLIVNDSR